MFYQPAGWNKAVHYSVLKKDVKAELGLPLVSVREDMEGEVSVDVVYTGDYPINMIQRLCSGSTWVHVTQLKSNTVCP